MTQTARNSTCMHPWMPWSCTAGGQIYRKKASLRKYASGAPNAFLVVVYCGAASGIRMICFETCVSQRINSAVCAYVWGSLSLSERHPFQPEMRENAPVWVSGRNKCEFKGAQKAGRKEQMRTRKCKPGESRRMVRKDGAEQADVCSLQIHPRRYLASPVPEGGIPGITLSVLARRKARIPGAGKRGEN